MRVQRVLAHLGFYEVQCRTIMVDPLLITFICEAKKNLARVNEHLAAMDRGVGMAGSSAINDCYCAIHTISGLAGYLAQERILVLAQSTERLLEDMRLNRLHRVASRIDALLRAVTRLIELVESLQNDTAPVTDDVSDQEIIRDLRARTVRPTIIATRRFRGRDDHSVPRFSNYGNQIPSGPPRRTVTSKVGQS